jgi:NTE family protein
MHCTPVAHRATSRLALVLGSGGVKSIAGLGVAQALEAHSLKPDLVVGSSAGAIFGALIARGDRATDAMAIALRLWSREVTSRRRMRAYAELALPGLAGFGEDFALRDDSLMLERLHQAFGESRLEDLPVPFHVAATDASTGQAVLIRRGRIVDALRATVALPFLFAPWPVEGRLLMDGSVADPLPLAAAAHAQTTVAVGFECPMPQHVNSASRLATRVASALTNNLMHASIAAAHPQRCHVLLPRPARRVGLFDTQAMPELVALGHAQGTVLAAMLSHSLDAQRQVLGLSALGRAA